MPLRVHILSPTTNCAGATKCAVAHGPYQFNLYFKSQTEKKHIRDASSLNGCI